MRWCAAKLSIVLAIAEFFSYIFRREKLGFHKKKVKFRIWDEGIQGKIEAKSESILLYTFLKISSQKINILKRSKLGPIELNGIDDINVKKMVFNSANILWSTTKRSKKWFEKKKCSEFFYTPICYRAL